MTINRIYSLNNRWNMPNCRHIWCTNTRSQFEFVYMTCNMEIPWDSEDEGFAAMLVQQTKTVNDIILFKFHQHGRRDVWCKSSISDEDRMRMFYLADQIHTSHCWGLSNWKLMKIITNFIAIKFRTFFILVPLKKHVTRSNNTWIFVWHFLTNLCLFFLHIRYSL